MNRRLRMRHRLLSAATAALAATVIAVPGAASPARADDVWTTDPPVGCYFSYLQSGGVIIGGYTECLRNMGLHRAVAQCADGTTVYGYTEEMEYGLQSIAVCGDWFYGYRPATAAWGEYHLDY